MENMLSIRSAKESDFAKCVKLFDKPELKNARGTMLEAEDLIAYLEDNLFVVAEIDGEVVAAMFGELLKNKGVILWEFSVDENFQGQGIGSELLKEFEKRVEGAGREWIFLTSPSTNEKTVNFYLKNGFEKGISSFEFWRFLK